MASSTGIDALRARREHDHPRLLRYLSPRGERDGTRALTALFQYIVKTNPAVERDVLRGLLPGDRGTEVEEA